MAWRLAASARVEDVVDRWGGEEFIVILPQCGATIPVTVSVGCTGGTDHSLVERADAALCPSP